MTHGPLLRVSGSAANAGVLFGLGFVAAGLLMIERTASLFLN